MLIFIRTLLILTMKIKCNYEQIMRMILAFLCFGLLGSKIAKAQGLGLHSYEGTFVKGWGQHVNFDGEGSATMNYFGTTYSNTDTNGDDFAGVFAPDTVSTITNTSSVSNYYLHAQSVRHSFYPPSGTADGVNTVYADTYNLNCLIFDEYTAASGVGDLSFDVSVYLNGSLAGSASAIGGTTTGARTIWNLCNAINLIDTVDGDVIDIYFNPYSPSGTASNIIDELPFANLYLADCSSGFVRGGGACSVIPIPEPSTIGLFTISLLGMAMRRNRQ